MTAYTENALGFHFDRARGQSVLENKCFRDEKFEQLIFGPVNTPGAVLLSNVSFERCKVSPGTIAVRAGVKLEKVCFDSVSSKDLFIGSAHAVFKHVVVKGKSNKKGLWIRPDEVFDKNEDAALNAWAREEYLNTDWALDISAYEGDDVEIMGMPLDKVRMNPARHLRIKKAKGMKMDWNALKISKTGYWGIAFLRLDVFDVECAIIGLPAKKAKNYEQSMHELSVLRDHGWVD